MSIYEFHSVGGMPYMLPLSICLIINLVLMVLTIAATVRGQPQSVKKIELIRQVGIFALAWGAFGTLVGLFRAFGDISRSTETIPWQVISGGLKVGLITVLYGFGIFLFTMAALIAISQIRKE